MCVDIKHFNIITTTSVITVVSVVVVIPIM